MRLNHMSGSQCGYCSPGMVMGMYGLLEGAGSDGLTASQVESSLSGNLCRCTGYRPILDAFKSLAVDASSTNACADIEDLQQYCKRTGTICGQAIAGGMCRSQNAPHCNDKEAMMMDLTFVDDRKWYKVYNIKSLLDILSKSGNSPYMLVAGDTAHGVYRRKSNLKIFIDIMSIPELRSHSIGVELMIGANVTLNEMIDILNKAARTSGYEYCKSLATHIEKIANVPVRNVSVFLWFQRSEF